MIKILYVDDEESLLDIGKLFLERDGDCRVDTISSAQNALVHLQNSIYDAIISDFEMPGMNGIGFLKEVRQSGDQIPFILFTGRGREEVVIQALNEGADFYLQKGGDLKPQFAELKHKVRQAVQQRKSEGTIRDHERLEADILNFLPDATFAIDNDGNVIAWNQAIEDMTGIFASEMLGKGNYEYAIPFYGFRRRMLIDMIFESDKVIGEQYAHIIHENNILIAETTYITPKGEKNTYMAKASLLYDRFGKKIGAIESIRDITIIKARENELQALNEEIMASQEELHGQYEELVEQERRIRESESRLSYMLQFYQMENQQEGDLVAYAAEGAGVVTGSDLGYIAFLNPVTNELEVHGLSQGHISLLAEKQQFPLESHYLWQEVVQKRDPVISEVNMDEKPHNHYPFQSHLTIFRQMLVPIIDDDQVVMIAAVANKPSGYNDADTRELALLMQGFWQVVKRRRAEQEVKDAYEKLAASDEELRQQYNELAQIQEELRKKQEHLSEIAGTVPGVIFQIYVHSNGSRGMHYLSSRAEKILGYKGNLENFFEWFTERIDNRDRAAFMYSIDESVSRETFWNFECRLIKPSGNSIWIEGVSRPVRHNYGLIYNGVLHDVSDRKHAEIAIRSNEEKYRTLIETTGTGFVIIDCDGVVLDANQEYFHLTGHTGISEIIGRNVREWTAQYDQEKNRNVLLQCLNDGMIRNCSIDYVRKDGTIIPVEINATVLHYEGFVQIHTLCRDISERKRAEEALNKKAEELHAAYEEMAATGEELRQNLDDLRRSEQALQESEKRYRTVFENTGTATVVLEKNGIISLANKQFLEMSGFSRFEVEERMNWRDFVYAGDLERMQVQNRKRLEDESNALSHYEFRFVTKNGTIRNIYLTIGIIPGTKKSVASLLDITNQKQADRSLKESEKRYRSVIENIQDIFYRSDRDGNLVLLSPSGASLLGYQSVDDLLGKQISDFYFDPGDRQKFLSAIKSAGSVKNYETCLRRKDGTPVQVSTTSHYYHDEKQVISGVEGIIRDISELKSSKQIINERERVLHSVISSLPGFVYRCENDGTWAMKYISDGCKDITGYSPAELIDNDLLSYSALVLPENVKRIRNTVRKSIENRDIFEVEYPIITKSEEIRVVWERGRGIFSKENQLLYIEGIVTDITGYKEMEGALRQSNQKLRLLTGLTRHDILNQLTIINGYLNLALEATDQQISRDYIDRAYECGTRIETTIGFTREYEKFGLEPSSWSNLFFLIESAKTEISPGKIIIKNLVTQSLEIYADPIIRKVFSTMFENSIRHGKHVSSIQVNTIEREHSLIIIYQDDGVGIIESEKEQIFEHGFGKNSGIGLFLTREILAITGLTIHETGEEGKGARFEITIPADKFRTF